MKKIFRSSWPSLRIPMLTLRPPATRLPWLTRCTLPSTVASPLPAITYHNLSQARWACCGISPPAGKTWKPLAIMLFGKVAGTYFKVT
ncbi:hypothetical protein D9M69_612840 [compost metagenome]